MEALDISKLFVERPEWALVSPTGSVVTPPYKLQVPALASHTNINARRYSSEQRITNTQPFDTTVVTNIALQPHREVEHTHNFQIERVRPK